jgi:hypothetical protein
LTIEPPRPFMRSTPIFVPRNIPFRTSGVFDQRSNVIVSIVSKCADVIAAKLLGGKLPEILEAIIFSPKEPQTDLRAISIAGNPDYRVDPAKDDFFKRLIDLRTTIKMKLKNALVLKAEALDSEQQALGCVDTYRIHKMMAASVTTAR